MGLVNMGDDGLKRELYEEAYERLMGSKWIGPLKKLYKFVDNLELSGGCFHEDVP